MFVKLQAFTDEVDTDARGLKYTKLAPFYLDLSQVQCFSAADEMTARTAVYLKDGTAIEVPMPLEQFGDVLRASDIELFELDTIPEADVPQDILDTIKHGQEHPENARPRPTRNQPHPEQLRRPGSDS